MAGSNLLLIHSDQHRFDCLGVNGHRLAPTPRLDALAARGVNFTHAFTPCPLCVPERGSLLTGRWPGQHLQIANYDTEAPRGFDPATPTFSARLAEAGYALTYLDKWHGHRDLQPPAFGFDDFVSTPDYLAWRRDAGLPPPPRENRWFGEVDPHITPEQSKLAWFADRAIERLEARARDGRPFFLRWDPVEPHLPNVVPEPYASMFDPASIEPWPGFAETFEGKPYIQAQQLRTWGIEDWTWDDWAPIVGRYLGDVALMDAQIGRVIDALDALGLGDDTLVVYTADHGDMCGSHRMMDKHFILYDDVTRVPLIARWPGRARAGTTCDAFVSHALDLATTFCEATGVETPEGFMGRSLRPLLEGDASNGREDIFSAYHGNQFGLFSQRMVRDRRWKYVWNATAEDELYDLEADPAELRNLALDAAAGEALARLRGRLVTWMEATEDPLLNLWTRAQLLEGRTR